MPFYSYRCGHCDKLLEEFRAIADRHKPKLCQCGGLCVRDYGSEGIIVHGNPEITQHDMDVQVAQIRTGQQVQNPVLSRSLARVDGLRKVKARDGKIYAAFRTRGERKRTLARMGLE